MKRMHHTAGGFTLIETLVAITVLLLSIAGPMSIASSGIKNSIHARDQVTAFYLAQEGIEIVRAIRDENAIRGIGWNTNIPLSCFNSSTGCGIDVQSLPSKTFIDCANANACQIYFESSGLNASNAQRGVYTHTNTGTVTTFNRSIRITQEATGEYAIDATVIWVSHGTQKDLTVRARIFDQYDNI